MWFVDAICRQRILHVSIYRDEICIKGKTKKKNRPKIGLTFVSTECLLYKIGSTNRNVISDLKITKLFSLRLGLCASNRTMGLLWLALLSPATTKLRKKLGQSSSLITVPKRNPTQSQVPAQSSKLNMTGWEMEGAEGTTCKRYLYDVG